MKKIAIIDDNKAARDALKNILDFNFENTFSIKEANNVSSGHKLILEFQPDIVLLDVEMGDGNGLDLIELFSEITFKLIFITAHKDYAIKAIKHRPYGYLLKPINPFDLIKVINLLISKEKQIGKVKKVEKIAIKNHDTTLLLQTNQIIRFEAQGTYTKVVSENNKLLSSKHLKHFEELLHHSGFLRVHHSHLVNTNFIKSIDRHVQNGIIMCNNDKIPVSARKVKEVNQFLEALH